MTMVTRTARDPLYRGDIDGLRALAVALVVLFHAWPEFLPGGFVGVDIFFVISGYLITAIVLSKIRQGRFSYPEFFGRRIRRIGPALVVVLLASLGLGLLLSPYADFAALGRQVTMASVFSANILFWLQSGYFDGVATTKPLLHLWSLGVEEQFYLVWPSLVVAAAMLGARSWAILPPIVALSFAANVALVGAYPDAAFYLLPYRLWEPGLGGLLVWYRPRRLEDPELERNNVKAWTGIAAIAISALCLDSYRPYPGWWALLPAIGATMVIDAGQNTWLNSSVLSSAPFRAIGRISYPFYLWHWPLLAFASLAGLSQTAWKIGILSVSLVLAYLTYRYVEVPIRFSRSAEGHSSAGVVLAVVTGMAFAASVGFFAPIWQQHIYGLPAWAVEDYRAEAETSYRQGSCFLVRTQTAADFTSNCDDSESLGLPGSRPRLMLWGDSHAADLYPGFRAEQQKLNHGFFLAQFTASLCPPIFGVDVGPRQNCHGVVNAIEGLISRTKPDVVIMSAEWPWYLRAQLNPESVTQTVRRLLAMGVAHVIVLGPVPEWDTPLPQALAREINRPADTLPEYLPNAPPFDVEARIRAAAIAGGARYISAIDALCKDRLACLATVMTFHGPTPTAWDKSHLTAAGSVALVDRIWDGQIGPDLVGAGFSPVKPGHGTELGRGDRPAMPRQLPRGSLSIIR